MEGQSHADDQTNGQPNTGDATGQQGGDAAAGNGGQGNDDKKFSQAELDAIVKDRLDRHRRATEADAAKQRAAADAKALEEQSQFKELANQRQARIAELEPLEGRLKEAEDALGSLLEQERKGLPAHITSLLDGLSQAKQLTWIATNRDAIKAATTNGHGGPPQTPKPADQTALSDAERAQLQERERSRYASIF